MEQNMISQNISKYFQGTAKILMVFIVLITTVLLLEGIIIGIIPTFFYPEDRDRFLAEPELKGVEQKQQQINKAQKQFLYDGTVHLVYTPEDQITRGDEKKIEVYDKNYDPLWTGKRKDNPHSYLSWSRSPQGIRSEYFQEMQMVTPEFSDTLVIPVISEKGRIIQRWRYEQNKKYFTGYDSGGKLIGHLGPNGFSMSQSQVEPFEELRYITAWTPKKTLSPVILWQTKNQLFQINFADQDCELLFDAQGRQIDRIMLNNWRQIVPEYSSNRPFIHLKTKNEKHFLLLRNPSRQIVLKTSQEWDFGTGIGGAAREKIFVKYYRIKGRPKRKDWKLLQEWQKKNRNKAQEKWVELYEVDDAGNLTQVNRFDWTQPANRSQKRPEWKKYEKIQNITHKCATSISPSLFGLVNKYFMENRSYYDTYGRFEQPQNFNIRWMKEIISFLHPAYKAANLSLTLLMMCLVFRHGWPRRTSYIRLISWLVFVGLFNLAGFLTYMALNHTPIIRCSECGKKRGLERSDCPACRAELPVPEKRSTDLIMAKNN